MPWDEDFKKYAVDLGRIYKEYPEQILCCLGFDSVIGSLMSSYNTLIKDDLPPIEGLSLKRKETLWNQSAAYAESKSKRIMVSKCIYLLEELTKI